MIPDFPPRCPISPMKMLGFQDSLIFHEFLHLRVPTHGRVFRTRITACVPG
jgi:predicted metal-dependent hydrolase